MLEQAINNWTQERLNALTLSYKQKGFEASGEWERSLNSNVNIKPNRINVKLLGAFYTQYMIDGRGPTPEGTQPSKETLVQAIEKWINSKGLDLNPFAVAKNIHKFGTKQYRNPNATKKRLITDAITEADVKSLIDIIKIDTLGKIRVDFKKVFGNGN